MPLQRAQLYADSITTLVDFKSGFHLQASMRHMVSRLKALSFPKLVALQGLRIESSFQISLLKHFAQNAPGLHTIQVETWPENGSILSVLSRFTGLTDLDVDLAYSGPRAVDGLNEDPEDDTEDDSKQGSHGLNQPGDVWTESADATVWKSLTSASLSWGRTGWERIPPKMTKTLARCDRLAELRLRSKVYGDDLGPDFEGPGRGNPSFQALRTLELWPADRRAWERVGAMAGLRVLTLTFCPGEAEPEDLLCLSSLSGLTELIIVQRESISRAEFPLAADHLLEITTAMKGLEVLRCDLASGSLRHSKGLTERITREHPGLKELHFGFGVYQPYEALLASSSLPRHQSLRRLLVSTMLVANGAGEHGDNQVDSHEGLERAANAFKTLFPQLEGFGSTEDCYEKVY
ncbi:hypothetical protein ColLi_12877 [Colletotrichum liriopes]|uniref:F-box domain-containing protein n=1 Tax=Colletotrichum liriopes TaxID=708192 RepID=A0AA37LZ52_9PEZI|nr:hypothetical protein ColLi_12877 [Colletotrichum liriopes]